MCGCLWGVWRGVSSERYAGQQKLMVFVSAGLEGEVHPRKLHEDLHRELHGGGLCNGAEIVPKHLVFACHCV